MAKGKRRYDSEMGRFIRHEHQVSEITDIATYYLKLDTSNDPLTGKLTTTPSTTSRASLNIPSGTAPTSFEQGDMYAENNTLHFIAGRDHRTVNLSDGVITADTTVADTTTETSLFTESLSANELHLGQLIKCRLLGYYSTGNASDTFTLRFKIGGTTVITLVSTAANVSNGVIDVEFILTVRAVGVSGEVATFSRGNFNNELKSSPTTGNASIDTSSPNDIEATIEWVSADVNNTLTIEQAWCEFIN